MHKINKNKYIIPLVLSAGISSYVMATDYYFLDNEFFQLSNPQDVAVNINNPIIPQEMYIEDDGDIRVIVDFDQSGSFSQPEACVLLDKIEILTSQDEAFGYDSAGNPIVTQWQTTWERGAVRDPDTAELDMDLIKDFCLDLDIVDNYKNRFKSRGEEDKWSFYLRQGKGYVDNRYFNEISEIRSSALRVQLLYIPKYFPYSHIIQSGNIPQLTSRSENWQIAFKTSMSVNLESLIPQNVEVYDNKLKNLTQIPGWDLPSAYTFDDQGNMGCLGGGANNSFSCSLSSSSDIEEVRNDMQEILSALGDSVGDLTDTDGVNYYDVIVMCPGSTIPEHLNLVDLTANGIQVPQASHLPLPQVYADQDYTWCGNIEKIERKWSNLSSFTEEGWMVSVNQKTGNLECVASNGICANSLIDNISLSDINTVEDALNIETLVLTGAEVDCQYKNGSAFICPSSLSIDSPSISSVINNIQQKALLDVFTLSFDHRELILEAGENITTQNRRLLMQNDGNLVLYRYVDGINEGALWSAKTQQTGATKVVFQNDGNLVIRDADKNAIWSTATHVGDAQTIKLQGDGNLVIYAASGEALWSTDTAE